jgi:hypothetical protein
LPKPPRAPDDGSQPPAAVLVFIAVLLIGLPALATVLEWFGISWRSFLPHGESDNWTIAAMFSPLVIVPLIILTVKLWQAHRAAKWQQVTGRITKSEIGTQYHQFAGAESTVRNMPDVEYEFSVAGVSYRGARIAITDTSGEDIEPALDRYPVGKAVTVYYDPADPNNCVLEREIPKGLVSGCMLILVVLALGIVGFYFAVTNATRLLAGIIPDKGNAPATVFAICFGLAVLWLFLGFRNYVHQAAKWPTVRGKVETSTTESYVKREDGRDQTEYTPVVEYVYQVRGHDYRSRQINLGIQVGGSQFIADKIAAKYPQGSDVTVHYNPENPSSAALENPGGYAWLLLVVAIICFAIALFASGFFR